MFFKIGVLKNIVQFTEKHLSIYIHTYIYIYIYTYRYMYICSSLQVSVEVTVCDLDWYKGQHNQ